MGGVGKSQLAKEIAHQIRNDFPDGQLFIHLGRETAAVPGGDTTYLHTLQRAVLTLTNKNELPADEHSLIDLYRTALANRHVLVQLIMSGERAHARTVSTSSNLCITLTGREHIELERTYLWRTRYYPPLTQVQPGHCCWKLPSCGNPPMGLDSCTCLVAIGTAHYGSFAPIPFPVNRPRWLSELRRERLKYLVSPDKTATDPNASVKASLRLSYESLSPALRRVIQYLSVFPASFDVEAATAVLDDGEAQDKLTDLYLRSMLEWQEDTDRYVLHDLVQEFCRAQLADVYLVEHRYARHYALIAQRAETLYVDTSNADGLALFDRERIHIEAGWAWALAHAGAAEADELLITYGEGTAFVGEPRFDRRSQRLPRMQAMLDAARRRNRPATQVRALKLRGNALARVGELAAALDAYQDALTLARDIDLAEEEARIRANMVIVLTDSDRLDEALDALNRHIAVLRTLPPHPHRRRDEAVGLCNLGALYLKMERHQEALDIFKRYYDLTTETNELHGRCTALGHMGNAYKGLGEDTRAIECYEQAVSIAEALDSPQELAYNSYNLGQALLSTDRPRALMLIARLVEYYRINQHSEYGTYKAKYDELCAAVSDDTTASGSAL